MTMVLTDDEERSLDDETKVAMLEGLPCRSRIRKRIRPSSRSPISSEAWLKRDPRAVDDSEVGRERAVEREEAVIEDRDDVLG
jgi:hypothetical protein